MNNILKSLKAENSAASKYLLSTQKFLANSNRKLAISMFDIANCAVACANKLHDALWSSSNGDLNNEEFEAFCKAEENNNVLRTLGKQF